MALPIAPTPPLSGKAARDFLRRVKEKENIFMGPVPTPKIDEAIERILEDARKYGKRMKKLIPILLIVMLMGCASLTTTQPTTALPKDFLDQITELNKQYVDAIEKFKLSAGDLALIASFEIGFLKESVGMDINRLPSEAMNIMNRYQELADKMSGDQDLTDYQKGQIVGMRWRFLYLVGGWLWKEYGAGILSALKLAF